MLILFVAAADLRDTQQETCPATKDNEGKEGKKNTGKKKTHRKIQAQPAVLQSFAETMSWVMLEGTLPGCSVPCAGPGLVLHSQGGKTPLLNRNLTQLRLKLPCSDPRVLRCAGAGAGGGGSGEQGQERHSPMPSKKRGMELVTTSGDTATPSASAASAPVPQCPHLRQGSCCCAGRGFYTTALRHPKGVSLNSGLSPEPALPGPGRSG